MRKLAFADVCLSVCLFGCAKQKPQYFRATPISFYAAEDAAYVKRNLAQREIAGAFGAYSYHLEHPQTITLTISSVTRNLDDIEQTILAEEVLVIEDKKELSLLTLFIFQDDFYVLVNQQEQQLLSVSLKDLQAQFFAGKQLVKFMYLGLAEQMFVMEPQSPRILGYAVYTTESPASSQYPINRYLSAKAKVSIADLELEANEVAVVLEIEQVAEETETK